MKPVTVTPGIACGYWNARKRSALRALVGAELGDVVAVKEDLALGDLVGGWPMSA